MSFCILERAKFPLKVIFVSDVQQKIPFCYVGLKTEILAPKWFDHRVVCMFRWNC